LLEIRSSVLRKTGPARTWSESNNSGVSLSFLRPSINGWESDSVVDEDRREISWAPYQRADTLNRHKFLLDIDGNGWR
jgi:hypothetical protein